MGGLVGKWPFWSLVAPIKLFSRNRRHVGTGKNRHRRNDDSLPRYSFKIHKDAMDENGKAGVSARSFLNIQKEDKKMIRSLTQAGGRRYIQLKKMVSFHEKISNFIEIF